MSSFLFNSTDLAWWFYSKGLCIHDASYRMTSIYSDRRDKGLESLLKKKALLVDFLQNSI